MGTRRLLAAAVPALVAGLLATGAAPPASAAGTPCVSTKEYNAVQVGWTPGRVAEKFDTKGTKVAATDVSQVRRYDACGGGTSVIVNYARKAVGKPLRVTSKYR